MLSEEIRALLWERSPAIRRAAGTWLQAGAVPPRAFRPSRTGDKSESCGVAEGGDRKQRPVAHRCLKGGLGGGCVGTRGDLMERA